MPLQLGDDYEVGVMHVRQLWTTIILRLPDKNNYDNNENDRFL